MAHNIETLIVKESNPFRFPLKHPTLPGYKLQDDAKFIACATQKEYKINQIF